MRDIGVTGVQTCALPISDAHRMELQHEGAPFSVSLIKPASIGTPMPQHVKNYHEQEANFPPPIYAPEEVAKTILQAAEYPMRDAYIGGSAPVISTLNEVAPRLLGWISAKFLVPPHFGTEKGAKRGNPHFGP